MSDSPANSLSPDAAVSVRGICKSYQLGVINRSTFRDELVYRWLRLRGKDPKRGMGRIGDRRLEGRGLFHALDGVSFDVRPGEAVGLIGRNGAGKSTMLKILARITSPDAGAARIRGRVGSLLEVGTGFHPELTGRENIYMNGAILGMRKREIDAKFDEIVDFSEIGPFLDTPVKRYSSGMYVKLAFSVASSLDADVLLVDEVLAVGDAKFQKKSLQRMTSLAASGRTVIFVSHSLPAIRQLCSRCIWFQEGRLHREGPADEIAEAYLAETTVERCAAPLSARTDREGSGEVRASGVDIAFNERRGGWDIRIAYATQGAAWEAPRMGLGLRHVGARGVPLAVFDSAACGGLPASLPPGRGCVVLELPPDLRLPCGKFAVDLALWSRRGCADDVSEAAVFDVPSALATPGWLREPFLAGEFNLRHTWRMG